jgi:ligand-binding sensor domain-containing protein
VIRVVAYLILSALVNTTAFGSTGIWYNYTSMQNVRDAVHVNGNVFFISSGGIYYFSPGIDAIQTITTSDGLSVNDMTAITVDMNSHVWVGALSGALDRYNPDNGDFFHVSDIIRTDFPQKDITALVSFADTLLIGTGFGVSVYSLSRNEFNDSYIKFGTFDTQTRVTSIVVDKNYIWVGTVRGIARGNRNDPLLAAPDRWTTYALSANLPSTQINDLEVFNSTVFAATGNGLVYYDGSVWQQVASLSNRNILALSSAGDVLFVASGNRIYTLDRDGISSTYGPALPVSINNVHYADDQLYVLLGSGGAVFLATEVWFNIIPDGPVTNLLTHLGVDNNGILWAATASAGLPRGFSRYDPASEAGSRWTNYTRAEYPQFFSDAYYRAYPADDGSVWFSNWGGGITRIDSDGELTTYHNQDGLMGIQGSPQFIVTGMAGEDSEGNIWFTQREAANGRPLAKWSPGDVWEFLPNSRNQGVTRLTDLIVDQNDTKWAISQDPIQFGVFYYNEKVSIGINTNDWGVVTSQHGIPSGLITAIVEDNRGEIWVGSEAGLAIISNTREPQSSIRDIFTIQDQYINAIAVDPLNRKWVGTREGVFLLSPDGTQILAQYTMSSTANRILSDDVRSVAFDDRSGIVYFGTERGTAALQTEAAAPVATFSDLRVNPNPFLLPSPVDLKIDGLVRNSSVMVLSVTGRLIRSFSSPGGRIAYWDGRDEAGQEVASGTYIIVGISEDGSEVSKTKVTVVRR